MDNLNGEKLKDQFPSNSKKDKMIPSEEKVKKTVVDKVITGTAKKQKRSFGKKITDFFLEDDTKSVGDYILHDVLLPAAKAAISDMVSGGIDMLLYGERRGPRTNRDRNKSYVNYNSVSSNRMDRDNRPSGGRELSKQARTRHDFDEIVLDTRGEAEEVLSHLVDLTIDYGMASVGDLYDLVGIEKTYTDDKYGWTDLSGASVNRTRDGGYLLSLPRTRVLE